MKIGENVGIFNDDPDTLILRANKQKVRSIFRHHKFKGERVMRSVQTEKDNVFVNIFDKRSVTKDDVSVLIKNESQRISKSEKIIKKLKRVGSWIDGQITLEEVFTYDELYGSLQ